jgi:hypothetical protein
MSQGHPPPNEHQGDAAGTHASLLAIPCLATHPAIQAWCLLLPAAFAHCCSLLSSPPSLPLQVLRMSPAEVYQVRQRVVDLATHLNQRTLQLLESFFPTPANLGQC